jgi:hypothetical protein
VSHEPILYLASGWLGRKRFGETWSHLDLAGGPHRPTLFKTLRNACDQAGPDGAVWLFELAPLKRVNFGSFALGSSEARALERSAARRSRYRLPLDAFEGPPTPPEWVNTSDRAALYREFEQAEQQMALWSARALKLERLLDGRT